MNNIIFLIIDSALYDNFVKAKTKNISKLGIIEKRYSYASWTSPSHYVYLISIMLFTEWIYK